MPRKITKDGITYNINKNYASVLRCNIEKSGKIEIPSEIEGVPLTKILSGAFYNCMELKSITITDSIKDIGVNAFYNCESITNIKMGHNVKRIGSYAFAHCVSLTDITLSDSIKSIGTQAFWNCNSLTEIRIPDDVKDIGVQLFSDCVELKKVHFGPNISYFSPETFRYCYSLEEVTISTENVELLDENGVVFSKDKKTLLFYPRSKKGDTYNIPDGVETIGMRAFYKNDFLKTVTFPQSVKVINHNAFLDCFNLSNIKLNSTIKEIGIGAFYNTEYFRNSKNWENDVLYIGDYLLCTKKSALISNTYNIKQGTSLITSNAFVYHKGLKKVIFNDELKFINSGAFADCTSLQEVVFSNSLQSIGSQAFENCPLKNINLKYDSVIPNIKIIEFIEELKLKVKEKEAAI